VGSIFVDHVRRMKLRSNFSFRDFGKYTHTKFID
jgi:hypothetical protein